MRELRMAIDAGNGLREQPPGRCKRTFETESKKLDKLVDNMKHHEVIVAVVTHISQGGGAANPPLLPPHQYPEVLGAVARPLLDNPGNANTSHAANAHTMMALLVRAGS